MTHASGLGYRCTRRLVYQRCWPLDAAPVGEELASIFEEGRHHEKQIRRELSELGFEVLESEVNFRDDRLDISGTIDGKLAVELDGEHTKNHRRVPVEIKGISGAPPHTAEQWRDSENRLLARYYTQLQAYMFLTNEPEGLGLFKSKINGLWTVVAVPIDLEHIEGALQRAEAVRDAVRAIEAADGEDAKLALLPERLADRSECTGCPWRDTKCNPAEAEIDPLLLVDDEALISDMLEHAATKDGAKRWGDLDKAIKTRFRLTGGDRFIVGGAWLVTKRPHGRGVRVDIKPLDIAQPDGAPRTAAARG
jgi:hypothetical protein